VRKNCPSTANFHPALTGGFQCCAGHLLRHIGAVYLTISELPGYKNTESDFDRSWDYFPVHGEHGHSSDFPTRRWQKGETTLLFGDFHDSDTFLWSDDLLSHEDVACVEILRTIQTMLVDSKGNAVKNGELQLPQIKYDLLHVFRLIISQGIDIIIQKAARNHIINFRKWFSRLEFELAGEEGFIIEFEVFSWLEEK